MPGTTDRQPVLGSSTSVAGKLILHGGLALGVLAALVFFARESGTEIKDFESWVAGMGTRGWLVFVAAAVVLMAVFVPSSVLGTLAGALFGLGWGCFAMGTGGLITAAITYGVASGIFRERITHWLRGYPKLLAIQRAVQREGARLQFMLRLAPINAVSVNYVLGSAGVRFLPYMVASLGMLPGLFVEVYLGHLAKHVSQIAGGSSGSTGETVIKVAGFVACVAVMIIVGRLAKKAISEAEGEAIASDAGSDGQKDSES